MKFFARLFLIGFIAIQSSHVFAQEHVEHLDAEIYVIHEALPITTPVQEFFGGALLKIQTHSILPACFIFLFGLAILILFRKKFPVLVWRSLSLGLISLLSIVTSLKIAQGWDELFINLKHAYALREVGHFSYNLGSMGEATVDFLPFFIVGLLGKCSLPLVESILSITLLGNVLLIIASWLIAWRITKDEVSSLIFALGIGIFPCVVYVGGTGFTATLFSAQILFIIYFLFFTSSNRHWLGLTLLASLTLVRVEGILLAFLIWTYLFVIQPRKLFCDPATRLEQVKRAFFKGLFIASPFLISLIVRKIAFGYSIPNPVTFKNAAGDVTYFLSGIEQLAQIISSFNLLHLFLLVACPLLFCIDKKLIDLKICTCLIIMALFCFPYFIGGGDWFPVSWGRYMMPFMLLFVLFSWSIMYIFFATIVPSQLIRGILSMCLVVAPFLYSPPWGSAFRQLSTDVTMHRTRWGRIDELGYFGRYLQKTTSQKTVIASPEMATVMYFAQRDLVDLMGIANPDVAHAPLNPILEGDRMHRKRFPKTLVTHRPGIVGLYGMVWSHAMDTRSMTPLDIKTTLIQEFNGRYTPNVYKGALNRIDIAYYRAGSFSFLKELGYHYFIVSTPTVLFNYFVHDSIYQEHRQYMNALGVKYLDHATISYPIKPSMLKNFSSEG